MRRAWIAAIVFLTALDAAEVAQGRGGYIIIVVPPMQTGPGNDKVSAAETACQKGKPPSDSQIESALGHADHLMTAYFALRPTSSGSDIRQVINPKDPTSLWRDETGLVAFVQTTAHLGEVKPDPKPLYFVTGGDGASASGAWQAPAGGADAKTTYYVAQFRVSGGSVFPGWKIWRMAVVQRDSPPPAPAPFCHLDAGAIW